MTARKRARGQSAGDGALGDEGDEELALATLRAVMTHKNAPSAARAQAARSLLEVLGRLGRHATPAQARGDAQASEITLETLEARIRALEGTDAKDAGTPKA